MTLTVIFLQFFFAYTVTITDPFGPNHVLVYKAPLRYRNIFKKKKKKKNPFPKLIPIWTYVGNYCLETPRNCSP